MTASQRANGKPGKGDDGLDPTEGMVMSIHELENSRVTKWPPWLRATPSKPVSVGRKEGATPRGIPGPTETAMFRL